MSEIVCQCVCVCVCVCARVCVYVCVLLLLLLLLFFRAIVEYGYGDVCSFLPTVHNTFTFTLLTPLSY